MKLLNYIYRNSLNFSKRANFRHDQVRRLGQAPQGRNIESVESAWNESKKLFYTKSLSYNEFSKRVECLRLFVFWGLVLTLSLDLVLRPLKSNYWFSFNFKKFGSFDSSNNLKYPQLNEDNMTDATKEYNKICNF